MEQDSNNFLNYSIFIGIYVVLGIMVWLDRQQEVLQSASSNNFLFIE